MMTTPNETEVAAAAVLSAALDTLATMSEVWEHLTCTEADTLLALLALHGANNDAAWALVAHIENDDAGDLHGAVKYVDPENDEEPETTEVVARARAYVDGLL